MAKKQGYYDREDESIAMRKRKHRTKRQLKDSRDESYGDWGKRSTDWKGNHGGDSSVHKALHHSRKNRGRFSTESAELKYMPVVDREKDAMKAGDESPFRKEGAVEKVKSAASRAYVKAHREHNKGNYGSDKTEIKSREKLKKTGDKIGVKRNPVVSR